MDGEFPKTLFKYKSINNITDLERVLDIIENYRIYAPTRRELNDPLEGMAIPSFNLGVAGQWHCIAQHKNHALIEAAMDEYRILSLSSNERNSQLWAHYASNHTGVCIEFSTNAAFSKAKKIKYAEGRPDICIDDPSPQIIRKEVKKAYFFKSKDWEKESEYRLLLPLEQKYIEFEPNEIVSVCVGEYMRPCLRDIVVEKCKNHNIPVYSTWLGQSDYTIHIVNVDAVIDEVYAGGEDILKYEKDENVRNRYIRRGC